MDEFLNKKVFIRIRGDKGPLFFTATITGISDKHISFKDKYNEKHMFHVDDILQITGVTDHGQR